MGLKLSTYRWYTAHTIFIVATRRHLMKNQVSIGLVLALGKDKALVLAANFPVTVPIPRGYQIFIDPVLEEQGVVTKPGKVKFPDNDAILALITIDAKFKQARVEVPDPAVSAIAIGEATGGIDYKGYTEKLNAFLRYCRKTAPRWD